MRSVLLLILLSACTATDPLYRTGLWRPTGANDANLAAMISDPQDLVNGSATPTAAGAIAAAAVERYRLDKVRPLPASGIARIEVTGPASPATPAASGPN